MAHDLRHQPDLVYKILDRHSGLFSDGGIDPSWSTRGKSWTSEGAVKSHLTLLVGSKNAEARWHGKKQKFEVPDSWVVVRYVAIEDDAQSARALAERPAKK